MASSQYLDGRPPGTPLCDALSSVREERWETNVIKELHKLQLADYPLCLFVVWFCFFNLDNGNLEGF